MMKQKNESGQVLMLGIIMILILLFAIFFFFDIHNIIRGKMKLETAEQAAALSAASWQAKSLNLVGELNLLIAAENILKDTNIAIPEHLNDKEISDFAKGNARIKSLNEMQSRITFIGPLIALSAAQQTAKNNGIAAVRATSNADEPQNVADDFNEYYDRLSSENNIYLGIYNLSVHGYLWQTPYRSLLRQIIDDGIAVRPSATITGIEGITPSYIGDESLYRAVIACSKGYPAWCHWQLRRLIKMPDSYFSGNAWYDPDFTWIRFSQQSEIYPIEVMLNTGISDSFTQFSEYGSKIGKKPVNLETALAYNCRFYQYNNRWFPSTDVYSGPDTGSRSPWKKGIYLRRDIADHAVYGGPVAYAECVEHVPGTVQFKSSYSANKAQAVEQRALTLDRNKNRALVRKSKDSGIRVGGNFTVDQESSGSVAKPIGSLIGGKNPVTIPIVLPVFNQASLIPSTMQKVRIFSYEWPLIEKFIVELDFNIEREKDIYDKNFPVPYGAEYMLDALRLLGTKEFRRMGYNPQYSQEIPSKNKLRTLFDPDKRLYDPKHNPAGPGWLQQPMIRSGENMKLPKDAKGGDIYFYTAEIAAKLNKSRPENSAPYVYPPADETWIFLNGNYLRAKNGKFCDIMEDDPYDGCGIISGTDGYIPSGTNNGPDRL